MSFGLVLFLSIIAALVPAFIFIGIIYWFDRYEKEPFWLLTAAFLWGAIPSIIVSFIFNSLLSIPIYALVSESFANTAAAALIAPPVEETIKGLALLAILFFWRHEIDSLLDGIIYGAMVGIGFAVVENVYYFVNVFNEGGTEAWTVNIFMRAVVFGLNHSLFTSVTGLGVAISRMSPNRSLKLTAPVIGWMGAMFLHFVHNVTVSFNNLVCLVALASDWGGVWLLVGIIIWSLVQERNWIRSYLAEEVKSGTLTVRQYETACSGRKRARHIFGLLFSQGPQAYLRASRFFRRCSELAYKKHHYSLFQDEQSAELAEQLRDEIAMISLQMSPGGTGKG